LGNGLSALDTWADDGWVAAARMGVDVAAAGAAF
jgi:hypothetical protein